MELETKKDRMKNQAIKEKQRIDIEIENEAEVQKLKAAQFENKKQECLNELQAEAEAKALEFAQKERLLAIKEKLYTPEVLKAKLITTQEAIYAQLKYSNMNVVNMGGASGSQDTAGQLIGQIVGSFKAVSEKLEE